MRKYVLPILVAAAGFISGCTFAPTGTCDGPDCGVDTDVTDTPDRPDTDEPTLDCEAAQADAIETCDVAGIVKFECDSVAGRFTYECGVGTPDVRPPVDCTTIAAQATASCGGHVLSFVCDPNTGLTSFTCDTNNDGAGDIDIDVNVDVTVDGNQSGGDTDEEPPAHIPQCRDGIDNDGDSKTDYPSDPGCANRDDDSEVDSVVACVVTAGGIEFCDGIDNDCDGSVDNNDFDRDGFISQDCVQYDGRDTHGWSTGDCNDSNMFSGYLHSAFIFPGAQERGDWIRSDCNQPPTELDHGCSILCPNLNTPAPSDEAYETDGDAAFECVSAFFIADRSTTKSPLDTFSWGYQPPGAVNIDTYQAKAVTCDATDVVESTPGQWATRDQVRGQLFDQALAKPGMRRTRPELEALLP